MSGVQDHSQKAAVNVKFLSLLKEPCEELGRLRPSEVAPKMKRIIHLIYTIWANNQHYGSAERTGDLFLMVLPTSSTCYFIPSNHAAQVWNKGPHQLSWGGRGGCVGGLFQVTNEIIRLCTRSVSLDQIFEGFVSSSKRILSDCIGCCLSWKESYCRASDLQKKYGQLSVWRPFSLNPIMFPCFCSDSLLSAGTWMTAASLWWWTRPFRGLKNCSR